MKKVICLFIFIFSLLSINLNAENNTMILKIKYGEVHIELYPEKAPNHAKRFKDLADKGVYDNVVFHRVIDGFMAQSGDVKFGKTDGPDFNISLAGTGGSDLPDLKAEFSDIAHVRGTLSAARSANPNSANSQFFICFQPAPHLDRQYTAFGKVIKGMEFIDKIKKGAEQSFSTHIPLCKLWKNLNDCLIGQPEQSCRVAMDNYESKKTMRYINLYMFLFKSKRA